MDDQDRRQMSEYQLHASLQYRVSRLCFGMLEKLDSDLSAHSITYLQWCVLSGIELEGHHAPSPLALHVGISRPVLSRWLKKLEAADLIVRTLDAQDGRNRNLRITALGREKIEYCWPLVVAHQVFFQDKISALQSSGLEPSLELLTV